MPEETTSETAKTAHVETIDGPSGAGKGTIAMLLAQELGYHLLDSGAVYRAAALQVLNDGVDTTDEPAVIRSVENIDASFETIDGEVHVLLNGEDVTARLRNEQTAGMASTIAAIPGVRIALHDVLRSFRQPPGLVADGRDMGTVVFPDACLKLYLTASSEVRAQRRYKQLIAKGISASLPGLLGEIIERDRRDTERAVAPLRPAADAVVVDTSEVSPDALFEQAVELARECIALR